MFTYIVVGGKTLVNCSHWTSSWMTIIGNVYDMCDIVGCALESDIWEQILILLLPKECSFWDLIFLSNTLHKILKELKNENKWEWWWYLPSVAWFREDDVCIFSYCFSPWNLNENEGRVTQNVDHACFPQALVSTAYIPTSSNFNHNSNGYLLFILFLIHKEEN